MDSLVAWARLRDSIIKRDGYRCRAACDCTKPLTVHHIIPRAEGGSDDPANLITLCAMCHDEIEPLGFRSIDLIRAYVPQWHTAVSWYPTKIARPERPRPKIKRSTKRIAARAKPLRQPIAKVAKAPEKSAERIYDRPHLKPQDHPISDDYKRLLCKIGGVPGLQKCREKQGLSQRKFAKLTGVSQASISLFESGKKEPPFAYLQALRKLSSNGKQQSGTSPFTPEHRRRKAALGATWQQVIEAGLSALEGVQAAK